MIELKDCQIGDRLTITAEQIRRSGYKLTKPLKCTVVAFEGSLLRVAWDPRKISADCNYVSEHSFKDFPGLTYSINLYDYTLCQRVERSSWQFLFPCIVAGATLSNFGKALEQSKKEQEYAAQGR